MSLEALKAPVLMALLVDMIIMMIGNPEIGMVNVRGPRLLLTATVESKEGTMMTGNLILGVMNVRDRHPLTIVIREVDMSTAREAQEHLVFFLACHSFSLFNTGLTLYLTRVLIFVTVARSDWDNGRWEWEDTPRRDYRDERPGSRRLPSRSPMLGAASPDARLVSPWLGGSTPRSAGNFLCLP